MPSSHYYGETDAPRRRSPLRLVIVLFFVIVLLVAGLLGALAINPALAYLLPGPSAEKVHDLAFGLQGSLAALFSDDGPLGGLRRFAEPYLSGLGLNLETVLVGVGLLLLVILCIWVLAATSRLRDEQYDADDLFGPPLPEAPDPMSPDDPYWPYDRRTAAGASRDWNTAGTGPSPAPAPGPAPASAPGTAVSFPGVATGDAWPAIPTDVRSLRQPAPGSPLAAEPAHGLAGPQPGQPPHPSLLGAPAAAEAAAAIEATLEAPPRPVTEEYLESMPAPAYMRPTPRAAEAPPVVPGPWGSGHVPPPQPTTPAYQPEPAPMVLFSRPGLGNGIKRFILPGLCLLLLGAGAAYGLTTSYSEILVALPYAELLLYGAAGALSLIVAVWFVAGPMRPRPVPISTPPAQFATTGPSQPSRFGPQAPGAVKPSGATSVRPVQAIPSTAPVAARPVVQGGLEPPDAADWSGLDKPSIFLPWSQNGTSVGLDIGAAWTKVVQISRNQYGAPEIVNLGLCPTPEGTISEGGIVDTAVVSATVRRLLEGRNIIQRQATSALGGQGVVIRHVQFPDMDLDELREVIRWEAEHHIPIPPSEAVVDFVVIPGQGDPDERGHSQMRVMLVGAQRKVVDSHVEAMKRARLVPKALDLDALACFRVAAAAGYRPEESARYAQAIIDLGHSTTKLSIYLRGALEMNRTLGTGGAVFTQAIAEQLQVRPAEAEALKRQYGVRPEGGRVLQVLGAPLQDLLFEIRRSFEFFSSRHFGQSVRQVFLVGGGARMPGIADAFTRYLNPALRERVPEGADTGVEIIDPLSAARLTRRLATQAGLVGPEFVLALGLAMGAAEAEGVADAG